jgi:hypothetical protein
VAAVAAEERTRSKTSEHFNQPTNLSFFSTRRLYNVCDFYVEKLMVGSTWLVGVPELSESVVVVMFSKKRN